MKRMYKGLTDLLLANMPHFWSSRVDVVQSAVSDLENGILRLTTATGADVSAGSSATFVTVPSESSSSTPIPHKGPPSTLRKFEQTFCLTHWWNPAAHRPNGCQCATTYPSSGKMEVYP